ncbi:MAG: hypothetical protein FJX67_04015 [Alphaproteobacteria bacterium]|nr:hypothetical protein [Alphaproteobacteria bacterium]
MADRKDDVVIRPASGALKAKLSTGPSDAPSFDAALLRKAEAAVKEVGKNYVDWANEDLAALDTVYRKLAATPDEHEPLIKRINRLAFEIKGQGGSFGYDLVTTIGDSLEKFTRQGCARNPQTLDVIGAHVHAMRAVLRDNLIGDGGELGRQIREGLGKATLVVTKKT